MAGSCFFLLSQQKRDAMSFAQRIKTATATESKERNRESVIAYKIYSFFFFLALAQSNIPNKVLIS